MAGGTPTAWFAFPSALALRPRSFGGFPGLKVTVTNSRTFLDRCYHRLCRPVETRGGMRASLHIGDVKRA